ncbi:MAG: hypothetical protein JW772_02140 [Candidatus Diapherotrites archaeon]|nr:hypothetical protein [Candidatus Diapherotrites archaeon]
MAGRQIISSLDNFKSKLPKNFDFSKNPKRVDALQHYFSRGGIISISKSASDWPTLIYPNKSRLKHQVNELQTLRKLYSTRLKNWNKKLSEAKVYNLAHNAKKFKEPLYWKHLTKAMVDRDYRADAQAVKLPVHLVSDKRWKPMVKMFVNDLDYRKQLTETVNHSVVYSKDKKVAKYADDLRNFRMEQSNRKISELEKKLSSIDTDIEAILEIMKWANS